MSRIGFRQIKARSRCSHVLASMAVVVALAAAGCGGSDEEPASGVSDAEGAAVPAGTPKADVVEMFGDPILTSVPTPDHSDGCVYYPMRDRPLINAWQFCFDDGELVEGGGVRALPPSVSSPPSDASDARQVLIGRADAICEVDYDALRLVTKEVGKALRQFSVEASPENRDAVAEAIEQFIDNIEGTHAKLSEFEPPADAEEALTQYLDLLGSQIETLNEAHDAFVAGDLDAYNKLGKEFTQIGDEAKAQAESYGLVICSASDFG
jgi:hypothetical protein